MKLTDALLLLNTHYMVRKYISFLLLHPIPDLLPWIVPFHQAEAWCYLYPRPACLLPISSLLLTQYFFTHISSIPLALYLSFYASTLPGTTDPERFFIPLFHNSILPSSLTSFMQIFQALSSILHTPALMDFEYNFQNKIPACL